MKRRWKQTAGFTLVELIVVIAILGILSGVAVPTYSGYVKKANMAADEQLAADVKTALTLAHYAGTLTPGDYVIVKHVGPVVAKNKNDPDSKTAEAAMKATFGDGYESMNLKYDGWDLGVVADAEMMGYVNASSYNSGGLSNLLGQVQTVVNAAGRYVADTTLDSEELLAYLNKAGVELQDGNYVTAETAPAVANAAVFSTANSIVSAYSGDENDFYSGWINGAVSDNPLANEAAKYALTLGLATYLDETTKDTATPTSYVSQLEVAEDVLASNPQAILTQSNAVLGSMMAADMTLVNTYLGDGEDKTAQGYKDAMAFLAYMDGVDSSSDSMLEDYDLYNPDYFSDGTMENYVDNFINAGSVMNGAGVTEDAFVFVYNGSTLLCKPLD